MSKQVIKTNLYMDRTYGVKDGKYIHSWEPQVKPFKYLEDPGCVWIGEINITVEAPDNFDPVSHQVAALHAQKARALREYQERVMQIKEQLDKLLALENKPTEGK